MDVEFKRNLVKLLSGMLWTTIPLFALMLLLPHEPEIDYEPVLILLFFTLLLNIGVALLPMRRPFIIRYNNILFFIIGSFFVMACCLAILETGGVRSPLFPFLLLVTCFGTTFYASQLIPLLLMAGVSATYTLLMVYYSGFEHQDVQLLVSQVLFLFLITFFVNRLGLDSREQVRIKNEALRELKLLSEMDQATSNFVSAVSFEMRTPLTSIQGFSEMLLKQDLEEEKEREFIDIINKEAEHLTELVEELLDISRLESGKAKLKREEIEVYRFLRGNLRALETICAPRGPGDGHTRGPARPLPRPQPHRQGHVHHLQPHHPGLRGRGRGAGERQDGRELAGADHELPAGRGEGARSGERDPGAPGVRAPGGGAGRGHRPPHHHGARREHERHPGARPLVHHRLPPAGDGAGGIPGRGTDLHGLTACLKRPAKTL